MEILLILLACSVLGLIIHGGTGFLCGLFLGPIGVLIAMALRGSKTRKDAESRHQELMHAAHNPGKGAMPIPKEDAVSKTAKAITYIVVSVVVFYIFYSITLGA